MSTLHETTTETDFHAHVSSLPTSTLLVLYFHTPWAAPCAQMHSVLTALASTYPDPATGPAQASFVTVNAEDLPDISEAYDVTAVPFVVLIRGGEVLQSISGSDAVKVREAIEKEAGPSSSSSSSAAAAAAGPRKQTIPPPLGTTPREENTTGSSASALDTAGVNGVSVTTPDATTEETPSKADLFARLDELVKAAPVMLFMKGTPSGPQCGFSRQLVGILREHGVKYGFFNILADEDVRQGLKEFAEWPTFPQLWVKGELVGGLDIVRLFFFFFTLLLLCFTFTFVPL